MLYLLIGGFSVIAALTAWVIILRGQNTLKALENTQHKATIASLQQSHDNRELLDKSLADNARQHTKEQADAYAQFNKTPNARADLDSAWSLRGNADGAVRDQQVTTTAKAAIKHD